MDINCKDGALGAAHREPQIAHAKSVYAHSNNAAIQTKGMREEMPDPSTDERSMRCDG